MKTCPHLRSSSNIRGEKVIACMCKKRPVSPIDYLFILDWLKEGKKIKDIAKIVARDEAHLKEQMLMWAKVPMDTVELIDTMNKGKMPYRFYKQEA